VTLLSHTRPASCAMTTSWIRSRAPSLSSRLARCVTASICQLARQLEDNGTPIDYARRRRLPRLAQAQLDVTAWRRQRHILRHPATWGQRQQPGGITLPAAPVREHLARLRLIELLTGTHPRYLPGDLQLPATRPQHYGNFTLTMPAQLDLCLRRQTRSLLSEASIDGPVTWPGRPARHHRRPRPARRRAQPRTPAPSRPKRAGPLIMSAHDGWFSQSITGG
jgi:hypothetical protein